MDRRRWLTTASAAGIGFAHAAATRADDHAASRPTGGHGSPLDAFHAHFCGIHVAKTNRNFQILAQHYCSPLGDSMHQCLLFDSRESAPRLLGVEYIISDALYRGLPEIEKKYWHPHTYEVLAGGLTAPEMGAEDELKFMKGLLTTWGKTWHTWPDPSTAVPIGEPLLMWSLGADGQVDPKVVAERDARYKVSAEAIRAARVKAIGLQVPRVAFPTSIDQVGRQWTSEGEDKPTPAL